jgi:hypothetical protein
MSEQAVGLAATPITLPDDSEAQRLCLERRWTDGLPIIAPTPERVDAFVAATGRCAQELIGRIPPRWGEATVEKIAVNAVMAGCEPAWMGILLAAVSAMRDEQFNLYGVQATTHPCAPAVIVSGSQAAALGLNGRTGAFGPGWQANTTIGRALRLILLNLGGALPGDGDQSTQGSPAKLSYCVRENEEESPWESFRESRGFAKDDLVVTVAALEAPHNINDHASYSGEQLLRTIAGTMMTGGSNCMYLGPADSYLFLCPEHVSLLAGDGITREDTQAFLFEAARTPANFLGKGWFEHLRERHRANPRYRALGLDAPEITEIPVLSQPDDVQVLVVGGPGKHSSWAPGSGPLSRSVSARVE